MYKGQLHQLLKLKLYDASQGQTQSPLNAKSPKRQVLAGPSTILVMHYWPACWFQGRP